MTCERCGSSPVTVIDSPVFPWSGLALCADCLEQYRDGGLEVRGEVREMR